MKSFLLKELFSGLKQTKKEEILSIIIIQVDFIFILKMAKGTTQGKVEMFVCKCEDVCKNYVCSSSECKIIICAKYKAGLNGYVYERFLHLY